MVQLKALWIGELVKMKASGKTGKFLGMNTDGKARIQSEGKIILTSSHNLEIIPEKEFQLDIDQFLKLEQEKNLSSVTPLKIKFDHTLDLHIDKLAPHLHYGTDILAPKNTPIKAAMDGYVISSDWTVETGNSIGIQHANNIITFYKHNSQLLKKAGDFVKAGEAIAIIGNTGTLSSGPHLHFELWFQGKPLDPANYVRFN